MKKSKATVQVERLERRIARYDEVAREAHDFIYVLYKKLTQKEQKSDRYFAPLEAITTELVWMIDKLDVRPEE